MSIERNIKPNKSYVQLDGVEEPIIRYVYDYDNSSSALKTIIVEICRFTNRTLAEIYEYFPNTQDLKTSTRIYNEDASYKLVEKYFPRNDLITKKTYYLDPDEHVESVVLKYNKNPSKISEKIICYDDEGNHTEVQTIYKNAHDLLQHKIKLFDKNENIIREICEYEDDEVSVREYFYDQSGEMVGSRVRISENDDKRKPKLKKKKSDDKEKVLKNGYEGDDEEEILSDCSNNGSDTSSSSLDYGICKESFDPLAQGVSMQSGHMPQMKLIGVDLPIETY